MHAEVEPPRPDAGSARIRPMIEADLPQVLAIEKVSFPTPWPRQHFLFEIREQHYASNVVLARGGRILAYACVWFVYEELKINNIAVDPAHRGRGLGSRLLGWLMDEAVSRGCSEATLEVRPSNKAALALYRRHGFAEIGRRKQYYSDTREDAILMAAPMGAG